MLNILSIGFKNDQFSEKAFVLQHFICFDNKLCCYVTHITEYKFSRCLFNFIGGVIPSLLGHLTAHCHVLSGDILRATGKFF